MRILSLSLLSNPLKFGSKARGGPPKVAYFALNFVRIPWKSQESVRFAFGHGRDLERVI